MAATFELYRDRAGEYRWSLRHQNGNIIADSCERYTSKANAIKGIESVKENAATAPVLLTIKPSDHPTKELASWS